MTAEGFGPLPGITATLYYIDNFMSSEKMQKMGTLYYIDKCLSSKSVKNPYKPPFFGPAAIFRHAQVSKRVSETTRGRPLKIFLKILIMTQGCRI